MQTIKLILVCIKMTHHHCHVLLKSFYDYLLIVHTIQLGVQNHDFSHLGLPIKALFRAAELKDISLWIHHAMA